MAEFQVTEISKKDAKKYHRTVLFQIHGKSSPKQTKELGLSKSFSLPMLTIYWQNERIRIVRKVLKDDGTIGNDLFKKDSWTNDAGRYFNQKIGFEKNTIVVEASEGKVEISLNGGKPIIYRDTSIRKWPLKNYFNVGNYLQTKDPGTKSIVKYYNLEVVH